MSTEIYLNYCVFEASDVKPTLCKVLGGYFASDAWRKGDKEFSEVTGTKFRFLAGDDAKVYVDNKRLVRRLESDEEFEELLKKTDPAFRSMCKLPEGDVKYRAKIARLTLEQDGDNVELFVQHGSLSRIYWKDEDDVIIEDEKHPITFEELLKYVEKGSNMDDVLISNGHRLTILRAFADNDKFNIVYDYSF